MPERPAPMITTSKCSAVMDPRLPRRDASVCPRTEALRRLAIGRLISAKRLLSEARDSAIDRWRLLGYGRRPGWGMAMQHFRRKTSRQCAPENFRSLGMSRICASLVRAVLIAGLIGAASSASAQTGPFAGLAGAWSGGGTVELTGGPRERIRCR